jgi:hypothetical protein
MIRGIVGGIVRWWARLSYLWQLEVEGAKGDINAATAMRNADEKRKLVVQLNSEADAIEANVTEVEAGEDVRKSAPEYQESHAAGKVRGRARFQERAGRRHSDGRGKARHGEAGKRKRVELRTGGTDVARAGW